jgi:hypothetical protein
MAFALAALERRFLLPSQLGKHLVRRAADRPAAEHTSSFPDSQLLLANEKRALCFGI